MIRNTRSLGASNPHAITLPATKKKHSISAHTTADRKKNVEEEWEINVCKPIKHRRMDSTQSDSSQQHIRTENSTEEIDIAQKKGGSRSRQQNSIGSISGSLR
ncbi:hypothetical protein Taro_053407 [Colocasia esculenta]|uniref:Uncharacterized protein n=1 Tax=Colocasia esculenta TaxID=4460 RepID=A0A843XL70_COLES|nr:hypothetical protein [Colocasia esculenta]